jgi:hypothetical protein
MIRRGIATEQSLETFAPPPPLPLTPAGGSPDFNSALQPRAAAATSKQRM